MSHRETLIELEEHLLSLDNESVVQQLKQRLKEEEQNIKQQCFKGCSPTDYDRMNKKLIAVQSAQEIINKFV